MSAASRRARAGGSDKGGSAVGEGDKLVHAAAISANSASVTN
jgi:hypothetical protein